MTYYNIINEVDVKDLTIEEIEIYLTEQNLYQNVLNPKFYQDFVTNQTNENKIVMDSEYIQENSILVPISNLLDEYYEFLIDNENSKINKKKHQLQLHFHKKIFGLTNDEKRKIALAEFNHLHRELNIIMIDLVDEEILDNGIKKTRINTGKIFELYLFQSKIKAHAGYTYDVNNFLIGNKEYFNEEFYKNPDIIQIINFEISIQILIDLNSTYNFEEDLFFTKIFYYEGKFEDYIHVFRSITAYKFTDKIIKSLTEVNRSNIESLYETLQSNELIKKHKENFMEFVLDEYGIKITKISTYKFKENFKHDERVVEFNLIFHEMSKIDYKNTGLL
jgi:hypothetical protein